MCRLLCQSFITDKDYYMFLVNNNYLKNGNNFTSTFCGIQTGLLLKSQHSQQRQRDQHLQQLQQQR